MSDRERVILIGLDGATYAVLNPLLAAGVMPNLKRLMGEGAWGILDSTRPPVTRPAGGVNFIALPIRLTNTRSICVRSTAIRGSGTVSSTS